MPVRVLQNNGRVAEVQFVCDDCGKIVRTSLLAASEVQILTDKKIVCCECKIAGK